MDEILELVREAMETTGVYLINLEKTDEGWSIGTHTEQEIVLPEERVF